MIRRVTATLATLARLLPDTVRDPLRFEVRSALGRLKRRAPVPLGEARRLNVGSAADRFPGFVGIDFYGTGADIETDLRHPLPLGDDEASGIFSEHTLEHLAYAEGAAVLRECRRVLRPGGWIRVIVPDVSIFIDRYARNDTAWFAAWEREVLGPRGRRMATKMTALSFVTQEYGHRSSWDFETMRRFLEDAGFTDVAQVGFRQGTDPTLLVDSDRPSRTMLSLYVEARKPAARPSP